MSVREGGEKEGEEGEEKGGEEGKDGEEGERRRARIRRKERRKEENEEREAGRKEKKGRRSVRMCSRVVAALRPPSRSLRGLVQPPRARPTPREVPASRARLPAATQHMGNETPVLTQGK